MTFKLAVILPSPYTGGVVRSLINICRMLVLGAQRAGAPLEITVGLPKTQPWSASNAEALATLGVQTRFFKLGRIRRESLVGAYACLGMETVADSPSEFVLFEDGIANFEDMDFWYLISDALDGPLPPHRRYACMVYDYANRYVPEIFDESQWRGFHHRAGVTVNADFVVTTTHQTRTDVINFSGADPDRVHVLPLEFDPIEDCDKCDVVGEDEAFENGSFILWPTIISGHENHLPVLRELEGFLATNDMRVVVIGNRTKSFDPTNATPAIKHPYVDSVRDLIGSSSVLKKRLVFLDFVSDGLLLALMRKAMCVLHTSRGDNGTYAVVEAAWQGTPAISNRYQAMQDVGEYFELPLEFFDFYRRGSLSTGLSRIRNSRTEICLRLPSRDTLRKYSYEQIADRYWNSFLEKVRSVLEGNS